MSKSSMLTASLLIICAVCAYILLPFDHPWFPQTADGEYYSARLAGFYTSLLEGDIPPRWAATFYSGLGYPVFNFNYPIPNILGSLFISFGSSIQNAMKGIIIISYFAGGIGMYFLLRQFFSHPLSPLVGSLLYLTAPYHIHDIFHRATTGELMMFGLIPYVLMVLPRVAKNNFPPAVAALVYAVYFLTHNLYSLMFLPLIIAFVGNFYGFPIFRQNWRPLVVGLLISCFFWIPALLEMKYTILPTAHINHDYPTELLSLRQTLKLPGTYQRKQEPPTLDSDQPGFAQLLVVVISLGALVFLSRTLPHTTKRFVVISLLFFMGGLFLINQASLPVWQTFSFVRFMQHPIRLYFIAVFFGAYLGAFVIEHVRFRWVIAGILILLTGYNYQFFAFRPVNYVPIDDAHYYRYPLTSAADNEFDPIWYNRSGVNQFLIDTDGQTIVATPGAAIKINAISHFTKEYQVITTRPTTIIEKTMYFPGWQTTVNGQLVSLDQTAHRQYGLINYDLPIGEYQIKSSFTQRTPARVIGNSLSLIGLGSLLFLRKKRT